MLRTASKLLTLCLFAVASTAQALTIFTCEPEWAALSQPLAPQAKVHTATHVYQDPHYIEARPSLIAKLAKADLAICTGAELEAGWLPALQKRAANHKVMNGAEGMLYLAQYTNTIHKHKKEFFSTKHVHPKGNPHFHLDPKRVAKLAVVISKHLQQIDPESAVEYQQALQTWQSTWELYMLKWRMKARALKGKPVVIQHTSFSYLINWLEMNVVSDLEPKPGVPPTITHVQSLLSETQKNKPIAILTSWYQNDHAAQWLSEKTEVRHLNLPATVDLEGEINSLQLLFDFLLSQLQPEK